MSCGVKTKKLINHTIVITSLRTMVFCSIYSIVQYTSTVLVQYKLTLFSVFQSFDIHVLQKIAHLLTIQCLLFSVKLQ